MKKVSMISIALVLLLVCIAPATFASWGELKMVTEFDVDEVKLWVPFANNNYLLGGFDPAGEGIGKMWYLDTSDMRDNCAWDFLIGETGMDMVGYPTIVFRIKMMKDVHLNAEVFVDGKWYRQISYYRNVNDEWLEVATPLPEGKVLRALRISIGEPGEVIDFGDAEVHALFDWIGISKTPVDGVTVKVVQ
ncbi:MAG: hypothetical protein PHV61_09215 [Limnochordia bacterium]|jgi:hypothetical protein|nr:hypothetical protein [Limnochordia bacterium]